MGDQRLISGPQGPRVVLDGRPVLLLCSDNYLGLADHDRVRAAAAHAATRWGAGAGSARPVAGTMTPHRRLEERLAAFHGTEAALLFGAGYLAHAGLVPALAGTGDVVFSDARNHGAVADGCTLAGAELFPYDHADADHLAWGLRQHAGRAALVVTEGVFGDAGDVAPLPDLVDAARRHRVPLAVDEAHAVGSLGPGGRGAVAEAGLEDEVDLVVGALGKALGSYGAYVAGDHALVQRLAARARPFAASCAPPPPVVGAALAALDLLAAEPRRVDKLRVNGDVLRAELAREGFDVGDSDTQIVSLAVGDAAPAMAAAALEQGVFVQAVGGRLRLTVMASHTRGELREAAQVLARAALLAGVAPADAVPAAAGGEVVPLRAAA